MLSEVLPRVLREIGVLRGVLPRVLREIGGAPGSAPGRFRLFCFFPLGAGERQEASEVAGGVYGWARETGTICQIGVLSRKWCIFWPQRGPVSRLWTIVVFDRCQCPNTTKYIQHLGVF